MLKLEGIDAGYGATTILHNVSLDVQAGEVVTIVGANGAGKTTTLRTIAGLLRRQRARFTFEGQDVTRLAAHEIVDLGITLIPEGRQLFPDMTRARKPADGRLPEGGPPMAGRDTRRVLSLFPRVDERLEQNAGSLSGGEQQMVAIAPRHDGAAEAADVRRTVAGPRADHCLAGLRGDRRHRSRPARRC